MSVVVSDLCVSLGGVRVLSSIDLVVERGEWLAPIGPNGAGKSTLLRALAGLVPTSGRIEIADVAVRHRDRRRLARLVAVVAQRPQLPPAMTVIDYVMLGRSPHVGYLGWESPADRRIAGGALERLDLSRFAGRALGTLSGGEAQRVALARALAQETPVLILDEPTSALDLGHQQQVLELVDALRRERGLTVVSAMHDLSLAGQYADRLVLIDRGRVAALGAPRDVLTPELIATHYEAHVDVRVTPSGEVLVTPKRRRVPSGREVAS
ncbi:MAG: ABC transporter ATP-binding protein [Actinomycetota bacterium]|jgi:iron complex transport system ATP-binding protein|nr:ABC transporter ATP-binding protein [Actinomycetota bacterium]